MPTTIARTPTRVEAPALRERLIEMAPSTIPMNPTRNARPNPTQPIVAPGFFAAGAGPEPEGSGA
ncbi:hypothetical protein [Salana multivorans]